MNSRWWYQWKEKAFSVPPDHEIDLNHLKTALLGQMERGGSRWNFGKDTFFGNVNFLQCIDMQKYNIQIAEAKGNKLNIKSIETLRKKNKKKQFS